VKQEGVVGLDMAKMMARVQKSCSLPKAIENGDSNVLMSLKGLGLVVQRAERSG